VPDDVLPAPGQRALDVIATLEHHARRIGSANESGTLGDSNVAERWRQYLIAVQDALPPLRSALGHASADALLLSPAHEALSRLTPSAYGALARPIHPEIRVLGRAVATQAADLAETLRSTSARLSRLQDRLHHPGIDSHLVVADTNVYLHGHTAAGVDASTPAVSLPWRQLLDSTSDDPPITGQLTVLLPDFVVTELDLRKSRGESAARRRARGVLRDLHHLFTTNPANFPTAIVEPQTHDNAGDGVDFLFLDTTTITGPHPADVDQALIDLAHRCRAFTETPVHFLTGDLSATLRAHTHATGEGLARSLIPHWVDWTPLKP